MVIKKSVLLSVLALGMLMQTPVSAAKPVKVCAKEAGFAVAEWFFNGTYKPNYEFSRHDQKPNVHTFDYSNCKDSDHPDLNYCDGTKCTIPQYGKSKTSSSPEAAPQYQQHDKHACFPGCCPVKDVEFRCFEADHSQNIGLVFESPAQLALCAVVPALLARFIQGKASATDYSKVAAHSFAGAMAASLLRTGACKGLEKLQVTTWKKTTKALVILTLVTECLILAAGQNPEVVKSMHASLKAKTGCKDTLNFISSLTKDGDRRARLAAIVRTFGPHLCAIRAKHEDKEDEL